jgi:hypothetical protein
MPLRRWQKVALGLVAAMLCLALAVAQLVNVGVTEYYSRDWHSWSSRESSERGLLIARLPTLPDSISVRGERRAVLEAWVEPQTHVIYRYFLFRRLIRDSTELLIVHTGMPLIGGAPSAGGSEYLAYNDSLGFYSYSGEYWIGAVHKPYPDTVRLFTRDHW